jgi:hypothetical protein
MTKDFRQEGEALNPSAGEVLHPDRRRGMVEGILYRQEIRD